MSTRDFKNWFLCLHKLAVNNSKAYEAKVKEYNTLLKGKNNWLDAKKAPHVFSGKLKSPKIIIGVLNPGSRSEKASQESLCRKKMNEDELLRFCENRFSIAKEKGEKIRTYNRINRIVDTIFEEKNHRNWKYDALHKYALIIDVIPFYSQEVSFKPFSLNSDLIKEIWDMILDVVNEKKPELFLLIGMPYKDLFEHIDTEVSLEECWNLKRGEKTIELRLKGKKVLIENTIQNIAHILMALTVPGISNSHLEDFANTLKKWMRS